MKTEIHFRMAHIHIVATLPDKVNETIGVNRLYMNNGRMESAKKKTPKWRRDSSIRSTRTEQSNCDRRTAAMQTICSATYSAGPSVC